MSAATALPGGRVHLVDCTLREGEQTPGVWLTGDEKLAILDALGAAGLALADVCVPAVSVEEERFLERAAARSVSPAIGASVRLRREDVDLVHRAGARHAFLIAPASVIHREQRLGLDGPAVERQVEALVAACLAREIAPYLVAEDASRADAGDLERLLLTGQRAGATRFFLCDTVGVWTPAAAAECVRRATSSLGDDAQLGVHCHDDFGMATANTIAAVEAGARWPTVTVNGLGERAGHASLVEVAMACSEILGLDTGIDTRRLRPLAELVEELTGIPMSIRAPLLGATAFRHESGMHVHGVLQDPSTYEPIDPATLGMNREIVVGKHTGRSLLRCFAEEAGLVVDEAVVALALERLKADRPARRRASFVAFRSARSRYLADALGLPTSTLRELLLDAGAQECVAPARVGGRG